MLNRVSFSSNRRFQDSQTLYFAYGSNMSLAQMALRCPSSRFVGRARLHGYKFQINERGFANVVHTNMTDDNVAAATSSEGSEDFTDGLVYRLTRNDEASLDRSEGVPTAYQKKLLSVEFWPAAPALLGRDVVDMVKHRDRLGLNPESAYLTTSSSPAVSSLFPLSVLSTFGSSRPTQRQGATSSTSASVEGNTETGPGVSAEAMVYLSEVYVSSGLPWDEYIVRMENGITEALRFGISPVYVERQVRPLLREGKGVRGASTTVRAVDSDSHSHSHGSTRGSSGQRSRRSIRESLSSRVRSRSSSGVRSRSSSGVRVRPRQYATRERGKETATRTTRQDEG
jgi:gamma-glutamylcyclotransferase